MIGRVYLVTNKVNGKRYVGRTVRSIKERWREHIWEAHSGKYNSAFVHAIRKYGPENFKIRELFLGTVDDAKRMETVFIVKYKAFSDDGRGYNLTYGGEGTVGWVPSKETRGKMSLVKKGRPLSKEHCEKMSCSAKGKPKPWLRGRKVSRETGRKISFANKGKIFSTEHCRNISLGVQRYWARLSEDEKRVRVAKSVAGRKKRR